MNTGARHSEAASLPVAPRSPRPSPGDTAIPTPFALLIAVGVAIRALSSLALGLLPFDDTYITFRYALNIAEGLGFVYNEGERVLGTTSPLWALALAAIHAAGGSIETGALILGVAADGLTALLIARLVLAVGFPSRAAVAGSVLFLATIDSMTIARSGMETALFTAVVLGALTAIARSRPATAGALTGAAVLLRPEGLCLFVVLGATLLLSRTRADARKHAAGVATAAAICLAWLAFSFWYFGSPVPQSIAAKASHVTADPSLARFSWMNLALFFTVGQFGGGLFSRSWMQLSLLLTLLAAVGSAFVVRRLFAGRRDNPEDKSGAKGFLVLLVFPGLYVSGLAVAKAFTWFSWYYGPIYPFLAILGGIGIHLLSASPTAALRLRALPLLSCTLALFTIAQLLTLVHIKAKASTLPIVDGYRLATLAIPATAGTSVAAFEIGVVGWVTWPARIIDLLGLVSPGSVGVPAEAILESTNPDYLVLRTDDAGAFLDRVARSGWLDARYRAIARVPSAGFPVEFRTYISRDLCHNQHRAAHRDQSKTAPRRRNLRGHSGHWRRAEPSQRISANWSRPKGLSRNKRLIHGRGRMV